jgi:hypothetical protein
MLPHLPLKPFTAKLAKKIRNERKETQIFDKALVFLAAFADLLYGLCG